MEYTENYNLKKPEYVDEADIRDVNENMDTIDEELVHLHWLQMSATPLKMI